MAKCTQTRLSIDNKIYKEKIRDDYPPSFPPSLSLSLFDTEGRAGER